MAADAPPVLCIVGRKNAGKTELTVKLAAELNRRGHRVMTVKHGHGFELDRPGKDSWRYRHEGGALRTVMAGPREFGVVGGWAGEELPLSELVSRFLWDGDVVLAEGFKNAPEPKIEVFRKDTHEAPLYDPLDPESRRTLALVTDDPDAGAAIPLFSLVDPDTIARLADFVEEKLALRRGER